VWAFVGWVNSIPISGGGGGPVEVDRRLIIY